MIRALSIIFCLSFFIACQPEKTSLPDQQSIQWVRGDAFGSTYAIQYVSAQDLGDSIGGILRNVDHVISTYSNDAILYQLNNVKDTIDSHPYLEELLTLSRQFNQKSNGYYDPTVEPLMEMWGFSREGAKHSPSEEEILQTKQIIGLDKFHIANNKMYKTDTRAKISFNAITGYINDLVARYLESQGVKNYLIEIGGEILAKGQKPDGTVWRVGIDKPEFSGAADRSLQGVVELNNLGLATSGNYRKFVIDSATGKKIVHTMDPKSGYPKESSILSVTILAKTAAEADAMATAVMAMGSENADAFLNQSKYPAMLISEGKTEAHEVKYYNGFELLE